MNFDYHTHSNFSADSDSEAIDMIEQGISLGLSELCFTEHQDFDYPKTRPDSILFQLDTEAYIETLSILKKKYEKQINVKIGVELGLQPNLSQKLGEYTSKYPFEFIIGSIHLSNGEDPYYPEFWTGYDQDERIRQYYEYMLACVTSFKDFDVCGHLDYLIRYAPLKTNEDIYPKHSDLIDTILKELIISGKGIEINTSGYRYGLGHPTPHEDVIKRYRELGGEIITIGSDAHKPEHIGADFSLAKQVLISSGFRYVTTFSKRKPQFIPIT